MDSRCVNLSEQFSGLIALLLFTCAPCPAEDTQTEPGSIAGQLKALEVLEAGVLAGYRQENTSPAPGAMAGVDRIREAYELILEKNPESVVARNAYGSFLTAIGRLREAEVQLETVLKLDPRNAEAEGTLGTVYLAMREFPKAAGHFDRAIRLAPDNAFYHFNLANLCLMVRHDLIGVTAESAEGNLRKALEHYERASRLEPLNLSYATAFAEAFYQQPDPDWGAALAAWTRVLNLSPAKDPVYCHLARVSIKAGNHGEARAFLEKVDDPRFRRMKTKLLRLTEQASK